MEFKVNEIDEKGLDLEDNIDARELDMETFQIKFKGPLHVKAHIDRQKDDVYAAVRASGTAVEECSRCLAVFETPIKLEKTFLYSAKEKAVVKLDPDIREEIMLDYPMKPLCKETCKGLCQSCGKNLNDGPCGCKPGA